jgi:hypothetical protein
MAETSDLFIIGAGASKPYGFPTGEELFEIIRKLDFSSEDIRKAAYKKYYGKDFVENEDNNRILNLMEKLASELEKSMMVSIDDFIRNRTIGWSNIDLQADLVKRIIAKTIFEYEKNAKTKHTIDWLHYLCSLVDRKNGEYYKDFFHRSKFVTFNYDRLLEYSIYKYLDYDKGIREREIAEMLNNNIIHANGYLGPLNNFRFGYDENISDASVKALKTPWDKEAAQQAEKIKEYIVFSNRVFFLGFGYLEENMKKLGLVANNTDILEDKNVFATAHKKTDAEIKRITGILESCGAKDIEINKERTAKDLIIDFFDA